MTGLYYYRARYYNLEDGKFLQVDSIGYDDQMNLYTNVGNDPVDHTDPSGMTCWGISSADCHEEVMDDPNLNTNLKNFTSAYNSLPEFNSYRGNNAVDLNDVISISTDYVEFSVRAGVDVNQ